MFSEEIRTEIFADESLRDIPIIYLIKTVNAVSNVLEERYKNTSKSKQEIVEELSQKEGN